MARKKTSKKAPAKSKATAKAAARQTAPKVKSKSKASATMEAKPRAKAGAKSSAKWQALAASRRKPVAAAAAAPSHDGVFQRLFDRVKPIFKQPLDPRIKHLVEVFGTEAVVGLMEAYRKRQDDTHRDELREAVSRAETSAAPAVHGTWTWHELMTTDAAGAKRFYRDMFGWESHDMEMMPGFNYTTFSKNGKDTGGMMTIGPEHGDMQPGWGVYVAVDDVDSAADKAEALGGEIIVPAHDIPVGRWAMIKDPAGAVICLYRAKM